MRGSLLWNGFLILIVGIVSVISLENDDLVFAENRLSEAEIPLVEKHQDESFLQRIKRGLFDFNWFSSSSTKTTTTTTTTTTVVPEQKEEDDKIVAPLIDEDETLFKETTTEKKTADHGIHFSSNRVARESGEENAIYEDESLVDEEHRNDRSNDIGHAESRRTETRYRTSDDEDFVGSGEAEGSAIDLDPPRRTDSKKTRFYRATLTIGEPYRRDYADRNSQEYKALSYNLTETLARLYQKEAPEDFTHVTVVKIENTTDAFKSQVTLDIGTSISNEDEVRNVLETNLQLHSLGYIQVSPEGFSFRSFQGVGEPANECNSLTELTCRSGTCVPLHSRCDGIRNCDDGSDELDCPSTTGHDRDEEPDSNQLFNTTHRTIENKCRADDVVTCPDGSRRICAVQLCDGIPDCDDESDEENCPHPGCSIGEFACDVSRCILESQRCDYKVDCHDGSDEHDCDYPACNSNQFKCRNHQCIDIKQYCNGVSDCLDGSDEIKCQSRKCRDDEFECTPGYCVSNSRRCDGVNDCQNRRDELYCGTYNKTRNCGPDQFECDNGRCININQKCDGRQDCRDYTDEHNCNVTSCPADQFRCLDGTCLNIDKRCDGIQDCRNGDDESQCGCKAAEFSCADGTCIDYGLQCNGYEDCHDGSDEKDCGLAPCPSMDFTCEDGSCIPKTSVCDGYDDCPKAEDELHCDRDCTPTQFKCATGGKCIEGIYRCDGHPDCPDKSDEDCPSLTPKTTVSSTNHSRPSWNSVQTRDCDPRTEMRCDDDRCISLHQKCDNIFDCRDQSDERDCGVCVPGEWKCANNECILESERCDGLLQCVDESDEIGCECKNDERQCANGICIKADFFCDGRTDCLDGSDERDCPNPNEIPSYASCSSDEFTCADGSCIPSSYVCNHRPDCSDSSDEINCRGCTRDQFQCWSNGVCIQGNQRCDRIYNCDDGSDEADCPHLEDTTRPSRPGGHPMPGCPGKFMCRSDNTCLPLSARCNGIPECRDRSDEEHCGNSSIAGLDLKTYPSDQIIKESREVVFQCRDEGPLRSKVRWIRGNGLPLPPGSTDVKGRLEIPNIQLEHAGIYVCEAIGHYHSPGNQKIVNLKVEKFEFPTNRPPQSCGYDQATCSNGECIPKSKVCDDVFDCSDGSDEMRCKKYGCEPNEYRCANKQCISKLWRCDGDKDCSDGSDEENCAPTPPGSPCRNSEFQCRSHNQCIPKSFHCDGERDCQDASDELGCSPVYITKPPQPMVILKPGDVMILTCTATGIPIPEINWRLNWGHVPSKCTSTSINGTGTLTCENIQVSDQGAYSCEALNIAGFVFAVPDAILIVKSEGERVCPPGKFNSEAKTPEECISCFCFGVATDCRSANLFTYQIPPPFDRHRVVNVDTSSEIRIGGDADRNLIGVQPIATDGVQLISSYYNDLDTYNIPYFALPEVFRHEQLKSYGGYLKYNIRYSGNGVPNEAPAVILTGNNITLLYKGKEVLPHYDTEESVRFFEGNWHKKLGRYEEVATRADIMMVLQNIDEILIKAKYEDSLEMDVTITNIVFDSADTTNTGLGSAAFVEECMCPAGYSGSSCQSCASSHRKVQSGQFLGHCVPDKPDVCPPGYFGDPSRNIACQLCPCPLTNPDNQHARTCRLGPRNEPICDCPPEYTGDRCEKCAAGYQGDPYRSKCIPITAACDPAGSLSSYVDPRTGSCRCKPHTTGLLCDECKDNAIRLPSSKHLRCLSCFCMGATNRCVGSNLYRSEIRVTFSSSTRDFALVESRSPNAEPIYNDLRVDAVSREMIYRNFPNRGNNDVYYWQLPSIFLGDRVTSYGGYLKYTVRYMPSPGGQSSRNSAADVILMSSNSELTLLHYASNNRTSSVDFNTQQTFTVPLLEEYWQREDGTKADRQYLLVALADVKAIRIKATYTTHTDEAALSMVSLDTAERFNTGGDRAPEVEECSCPAGYKGFSCEDCDVGYTRVAEGIYLGSCDPCNCNGHSKFCDAETGVCKNCEHHTTGDHCEHCEYGYEGDATRGSPHDCQQNNTVTPNCDSAGSENGLLVGDQCMCKRNVVGSRCDRCRPSTFGLSINNTDGCNQCFCSGVSNQCHESSLYIQQLPIFIYDNSNKFILTDSSRQKVIDTVFDLNIATNEIGYRYSGSRSPRLYWSLPKEYTGNKLTSYGSNLILTQHIITHPRAHTYSDQDVILFGNGITLYWKNPRDLVPGVKMTYSVPFRESEWYRLTKEGPRRASRIDLMTALTDVEAILVRATHSEEMIGTYISDIILEFGSETYGTQRATQVEVCTCPEGYDGNSCENCRRGYFRSKSDRSRSFLGNCEKCPCNNNELSCDLSRTGQVICHCAPGYTGHDCSQLHFPDPSRNQTVDTGNPPEPTITVEITEPAFQIVQTGNTVTYHCSGKSKESNQVRIKWEKDGGRLPPDRSIDDESGLLVIQDVTVSDSGIYICRVTDGYDVATSNVTLSVGAVPKNYNPPVSEPTEPRAEISPRYKEAYEGENFEFRCQATGHPQPEIRWMRANGPLSPEARIHGGVLRFTNVKKTDQDEYKCISKNSEGVTEVSAVLYVKDYVDSTPHSPMNITLQPTEWTGNSGDTVRITCSASRNSRVTWTRSGKLPLPYSATQHNGVLIIQNPTSNDSGIYVCTAINYEGHEKSETARITIIPRQEVPIVKAQPERQTVSQGTNAEIRCIVSGEQGMHFKWSKHGETSLGPNAQEMGDTLKFHNIQVHDRGIYICRVSKARTSYEASAMIEVEQRQSPIVELYPSKVQTVLVGGSADMQCRAQGLPTPEVHWSREDGRLFSHNIENLPGGLLRLTNVSFNDEGHYVCTATNSVGRTTLAAQLIIHSRPIITISPNSGILNVKTGDRVKLICSATGKPQPNIVWTKRTDSSFMDPFSRSGSNAVYEIYSVSPDDEATYTCQATNSAGVSEESVHIKVDEDFDQPPLPCRGDQPCNEDISYPPSNPNSVVIEDTFNKIPTGGKVELRCQLKGRDVEHIYLDWRRGGHLPLPEGSTIQSGILTIPLVTKDAEGEYICLGLDRHGSILFEAKSILEVVSVPRIELNPTKQIVRPGENPSILCQATGDEPLKIEWTAVGREMPNSVTRDRGYIKFHGITYSDAGRYACIATNSAGSAKAVAEVLVNENEGNVVRAVERDISTFAGNTVRLRCLVQERAVIQWSREGQALPANSRAGDDYLELFYVQPEDSGQYTCKTSNENGVSSDFINLNVSPATAPYISVKPSQDLVNIGDTVDLICTTSGVQNPRYSWSKLNEISLSHNARAHGSTLRLSNVVVNDSGTYRCTVENREVSLDGEYNLVVQGGTADAPAIETVSTPYGSDIEMDCSPNLDPPVKFHWKKLEGLMPMNIDPHENKLRIDNVKAENAGTYICVADNGIETLEVPNVLVVTGVVPYFHQAPLSYIALAPLTDVQLRFNIEVSFKTESYDGLILYNDETHRGNGDFLSLAIVGGYPVLTFELGSGPAEVRANKSISLSTWHTIKIQRLRKEGSLLVDGEGPFTVFASGRKQTLDLKEPLYVGGVPRNQTINEYVKRRTFVNGVKGFVGCISKLVIGETHIDLMGDQTESTGITSCETCAENACRNGGVCQEAAVKHGYRCLCRAGYSGPHCESVGQSCYPGACGEGKCVDLESGFVCYCPFGRSGSRCERVVNINKPLFRDTRSYLAYHTPKAVRRLKLTMNFNPTDDSDGILMYISQSEEGLGDFAAVIIKNRHVEFRFDVGSGMAVIKSNIIIQPGIWTHITVNRDYKQGSLSVHGEQPVEGRSPGAARTMSLNTPLYIGGVDRRKIIVNKDLGVDKSFHGCINELEVSTMNIDLLKSPIDSVNVEDCSTVHQNETVHQHTPTTQSPTLMTTLYNPCASNPCINGLCQSTNVYDYSCTCEYGYVGRNCENVLKQCELLVPCRNGGTCTDLQGSYKCDCLLGYNGQNCEKTAEFSYDVAFKGDGWLELEKSIMTHEEEREVLGFEISTNKSNGLIMWHGQTPDDLRPADYISLAVVEGYVEYQYNLGSGPAVIRVAAQRVDDGERHRIILKRQGSDGSIELNGEHTESGVSDGLQQTLNTRGSVYLGGVPDFAMTYGRYRDGFSGCIYTLEVQDSGAIDIGEKAIRGKNVSPCTRARWIPSSLVFPDADTDIFDAFIPPPPVNIIHPKPTPNLAFRSVDCFFLFDLNNQVALHP